MESDKKETEILFDTAFCPPHPSHPSPLPSPLPSPMSSSQTPIACFFVPGENKWILESDAREKNWTLFGWLKWDLEPYSKQNHNLQIHLDELCQGIQATLSTSLNVSFDITFSASEWTQKPGDLAILVGFGRVVQQGQQVQQQRQNIPHARHPHQQWFQQQQQQLKQQRLRQGLEHQAPRFLFQAKLQIMTAAATTNQQPNQQPASTVQEFGTPTRQDVALNCQDHAARNSAFRICETDLAPNTLVNARVCTAMKKASTATEEGGDLQPAVPSSSGISSPASPLQEHCLQKGAGYQDEFLCPELSHLSLEEYKDGNVQDRNEEEDVRMAIEETNIAPPSPVFSASRVLPLKQPQPWAAARHLFSYTNHHTWSPSSFVLGREAFSCMQTCPAGFYQAYHQELVELMANVWGEQELEDTKLRITAESFGGVFIHHWTGGLRYACLVLLPPCNPEKETTCQALLFIPPRLLPAAQQQVSHSLPLPPPTYDHPNALAYSVPLHDKATQSFIVFVHQNNYLRTTNTESFSTSTLPLDARSCEFGANSSSSSSSSSSSQALETQVCFRQRVLLGPSWDQGHVPELLQAWFEDGGVMGLVASCAAGKTYFMEQFFLKKLWADQERGRDAAATTPPSLANPKRLLMLDIAAGYTLVADKAKRWRKLFAENGLQNPNLVCTCYDLRLWPEALEEAWVVVSTRDSICRVALRLPNFIFIDESHTHYLEFVSKISEDRCDAIFAHETRLLMHASHVLCGEAFVNEDDERILSLLYKIRERRKTKDANLRLVRIVKYIPTHHFLFTRDQISTHMTLKIHQERRRAFFRTRGKRRRPVVLVSQTVRSANTQTEYFLDAQVVAKHRLCLFTRDTMEDVRRAWNLSTSCIPPPVFATSTVPSVTTTATPSTTTASENNLALLAPVALQQSPPEDQEYRNLNHVVPQVDLLAYTPVVRAGFDLTEECSQVFATLDFCGGAGSTGFLQMLHRVRTKDCSTVVVHCNPQQHGLLQSFEYNFFYSQPSMGTFLQEKPTSLPPSYKELILDFWRRHLPRNTAWTLMLKYGLQKFSDDISPEEATEATLNGILFPDDKLRLDLILIRDAQERRDAQAFGACLVDYIIQSGDGFFLDWKLPEFLRPYVCTMEDQLKESPSIAELVEHHGTCMEYEGEDCNAMDFHSTKGEEEEEEEEEDAFSLELDQTRACRQALAKVDYEILSSNPEEWKRNVEELKTAVTSLRNATAAQSRAYKLVRDMLVFCLFRVEHAQELEQHPLKIKAEQFIALRDALLGVYAADCFEGAYMHAFLCGLQPSSSSLYQQDILFPSLMDCLYKPHVPSRSRQTIPHREGGGSALQENEWVVLVEKHEYLTAWVQVMQLPFFTNLNWPEQMDCHWIVSQAAVHAAFVKHPWFSQHGARYASRYLPHAQTSFMRFSSPAEQLSSILLCRQALKPFGIRVKLCAQKGKEAVYCVDAGIFFLLKHVCRHLHLSRQENGKNEEEEEDDE